MKGLKILSIIASFAESGTKNKSKAQIVSYYLPLINLETTVHGIYEFASNNSWGITLCAPLNRTFIDEFGDQATQFIGSYCSDILPTMSVNKEE